MSEKAPTILVVDDEPDTLTYLSTVLKDNGYSVVEARDGNEALEKIEADPPALVALDVSMPEKSGVAVYRKLKEDEQLKSIPVIIITGISKEFEKFISTRRRVPPPEGYISKPVDHEELIRMVKELLG